MSVTQIGKFKFYCNKCDYLGFNMLHNCQLYKLNVNGKIHTVHGTHPEHACEILAKHYNKEIHVECSSTEYIVEKIEDSFIASVAFEKVLN